MIGGVDIGGTKIAVGMVDAVGKVLTSRACPTEPERGPEDGVRRIIAMLRQTKEEAGGQLEGIGIGCTGPVIPQQGSIDMVQFLPGWEGLNLAGLLSDEFGVTAALENDADAAALGEWAWGAGAGAHSFLLVTAGTGIGAGLVVDGRLYRGVDGSHPEMGHHVIDPSGPPCFCGAHGCWEILASGPAMEAWAQARHPQGVRLTARELCAIASNPGHPHYRLAVEAVQRTAGYLALGLANLVTLFSPDRIALGGGLLQSATLFLPAIHETVRANCGLVPHERVQIVRASLGAQSGLAGAARTWYHRFSTG